jgi:tetratricopeptide (TPR) repeat protein
MKQNVYLTIVCLLAGALPAGAADAVKFSFAVSQRDSVNSRDVLLYVDTAEVAKGIPASGFMAVMSVDVRIDRIDTSGVEYSVQAVTASQPASTASRQVQSEFGLPLILSGLKGKNGSVYSLSVRPLKRTKLKDSDCAVSKAAIDKFNVDPTAHTDLHYVKGTHGDLYWTLAKGLFESEYDQFNMVNRFNVPGKFSIYLCPCPISSVIWDRRFWQAVDPTKGTAFVLYTTDVNTADPFVLMLLAIHRQYGYAPAFLADGYANSVTLAVDEMKQLLTDKKDKPLASLLDTYGYFTADPQVADLTSATFIRFLIYRYSPEKFMTLYRKADDLNLRTTLETVYGKPVAALETDWRNWVDTVTIFPNQFQYYSERAEAMFDYNRMLRYARRMVKVASRKVDSAQALSLLARASFNAGDYYGATDAQRALLRFDTSVGARVSCAGYQMMNGLYDSARADLELAKLRDSSNSLVLMNLGMNRLYSGDTAGARQTLEPLARSSETSLPEAKVLLGHLYLRSRERAERAKAIPLFQEAVTVFQTRAGQHNTVPSEQMWLGMAFLGLDDQSNALTALQLADFMETRPFYRGIIHLWLGKAADLRGERDVAREMYSSVIAESSAEYVQREARHYLQTPYTQ